MTKDSKQLFLQKGSRIDWVPINSETLGRVDLLGRVVWLNENHPFLQRLRVEENADAILTVALCLFTWEVSVNIPGDSEGFPEDLSVMLRGLENR
jgi:hypothetical protein